MTADEYLNQIISRYLINESGVKAHVESIYPVIKKWGGEYILEAIYSGSIAKGTAVCLGTDADVFISLSSTTPENLSQIYTTLYNALSQTGYQPRKQNVSIGVTSGDFKIDFIPGKRQSQYGYDHSLYKNKANTWTKTNVKNHISYVSGSNRIGEIKLSKIWRQLNGLEFPSFYLEMAVIDCLAGKSYSDISGNFWEVLGFFANGFPNSRYVDPSNSNNIISDDLEHSEKLIIKQKAQTSRSMTDWSQIVW